MVKQAFEAQRQFLTCVSRCKQPSQQLLESMLKPTSQQISAVQVIILTLTLLVGRQKEHLACKKLSNWMLARFCLYGVRCTLIASLPEIAHSNRGF